MNATHPFFTTRQSCFGGIAAEAEILTLNGFERAAEVTVGTHLVLGDGNIVNVAGIHHATAESARISFTDGAHVTVAADQQLVVLRRYGKKRAWTRTEVLAGELCRSDLRLGPERRFRIPLVTNLALPTKTLTVDPYGLGSFLANGTASSGVAITTPDPEVIAKLLHLGGHLISNNTGAVPRVYLPKTIGKIRDLELVVHSRDKFIPDPYATASTPQRIELLHGLMDGDGGGTRKNRSCVAYFTTSPRLAEDVAHLVNSLGGTGTIQTSDRTHEGKPVEYRVNIMLPDSIEPFSTSRKKRGQTVNKTGPGRAIVDAELLGQQQIVQLVTKTPSEQLVVGRGAVLVPTPNAVASHVVAAA
jgi:phosphate starvation-inducible PhoH-like protein